MPRVIVQAEPTSNGRNTTVTLQESVSPLHLASDHHSRQLLERVAWAVADAAQEEEAVPRRATGEDDRQRS